MSAKHFYYTRENSSLDTRYDPDEDDKDDSDSDFLLQDVPYSSSSIDRNSINSIPWADDAIKQNQLDWERVERMLTGEEKLANDEPELRNEILEWQIKFPILLISSGSLSKQQKQRTFDSSQMHQTDDLLDVETISNLSLNTVNDDGDDDSKLTTPNLTHQHKMYDNEIVLEHLQQSTASNSTRPIEREQVLDVELRIRSIPIRQRQDLQHPHTNRRREILHINRSVSSTSVSTTPLSSQALHGKSPKSLVIMSRPGPPNSATTTNTHTRLRMPPILNVLETKRRFRGLTNNQSFVQLTQIQQQQQAKSAAVTHTHNQEQQRRSHHMDSWHKPLAATRITNSFLNNRNSIILPAIKLHRIHELPISTTTTTSTNDLRTLTDSTLDSGDIVGRRIYNFVAPLQRNFNKTTSTTPSTGRSISAAVHHQRQEFNAIYLPYSASKFKAFK